MVNNIKINCTFSDFQYGIQFFCFIIIQLIKYTINIWTAIFVLLLDGLCFVLFGQHMIIYYWMVYVLVALEETYHALMLCVLGKKKTIQYFEITIIEVGNVKILGGASIVYSGMFKKSDLLYISLAGPLMPLLFMIGLNILLIAINLVYSLKLGRYIIGTMILLFIPLISLIPICSKGYESDGYKIKTILQSAKPSLSQMKKIFIFVIGGALHYSFNKIIEE